MYKIPIGTNYNYNIIATFLSQKTIEILLFVNKTVYCGPPITPWDNCSVTPAPLYNDFLV